MHHQLKHKVLTLKLRVFSCMLHIYCCCTGDSFLGSVGADGRCKVIDLGHSSTFLTLTHRDAARGGTYTALAWDLQREQVIHRL
jgi:hypothetical protein